MSSGSSPIPTSSNLQPWSPKRCLRRSESLNLPNPAARDISLVAKAPASLRKLKKLEATEHVQNKNQSQTQARLEKQDISSTIYTSNAEHLQSIVDTMKISLELSITFDICYSIIFGAILKIFPWADQKVNISLVLVIFLKVILLLGQTYRRYILDDNDVRKIETSQKFNELLLLIRVSSCTADAMFLFLLIGQNMPIALSIIESGSILWSLFQFFVLWKDKQSVNRRICDYNRRKKNSLKKQNDNEDSRVSGPKAYVAMEDLMIKF